MAGGGELVGDEPVSEARVVGVHLERGMRGVRVDQVPVTDRIGLPGVERLRRELQHPAGHHDRDPVGGKVTDQRVRHFGDWPSLRFACDRYAAARRRTSFSCSSRRIFFFASRRSSDSALVTPGR